MEDIAEKLNGIFDKAGWLLPEIILLIGAIAILLFDLINKKSQSLLLVIFCVTIIGCVFTLLFQFTLVSGRQIQVWEVLIIDNGSFYLHLLFLIAALIYGIAMWEELNVMDLFLTVCILLGAGIVIKTVNLLVLLLGIEILSISAYAFTARQSSGHAGEAGLKYIIFGAVSTAVFIFGLSLLYGLTGDFNINSEDFTRNLIAQNTTILLVIFLFVCAGLFFKITAFPFHLWAPDVYQIVPAPLAAFFSVVPKLAVIGFMVKLAIVINLFGILEVPWAELLGGIAILTMTAGNLAALSQQDPQRMMAYSSIAHTGFFLLGITAFQLFAYQSVLFYAGIYMCMNFLTFLLIYYYQKKFKVRSISDYSGRMASAPFHGILLVIAMVTLTGLPPTAGFTAKFFIFSGLWQTYQESGEGLYLILILLGILNTLLSLFYYLKIPYFMIFKPSPESYPTTDVGYGKLNFLLVILVLPLLILFIWPDLLMDWINMVNFAL